MRISPGQPDVAGFHEPRSGSVQYVAWCRSSGRCAIIDPVLDFEEKGGATATRSADALLAFIAARDLAVEWILDTHPHADHLSAAAYLHERTGAPMWTGEHVTRVRALWAELYDLPEPMLDGGWHRLLSDGDAIRLGEIDGHILHSPGHTLASVTCVLGDAAFVQDTLFMPDTGTARADFPGGSAAALHASIAAILALPPRTRLFTGHDYGEGGREPAWESSVDEQASTNRHWLAAPTRDAFVALREARDATLPMPRLILHALQVNLRGGRLPEPDARGRRFLKLPLGAFGPARW